jgi:hypothetical protein
MQTDFERFRSKSAATAQKSRIAAIEQHFHCNSVAIVQGFCNDRVAIAAEWKAIADRMHCAVMAPAIAQRLRSDFATIVQR